MSEEPMVTPGESVSRELSHLQGISIWFGPDGKWLKKSTDEIQQEISALRECLASIETNFSLLSGNEQGEFEKLKTRTQDQIRMLEKKL